MLSLYRTIGGAMARGPLPSPKRVPDGRFGHYTGEVDSFERLSGEIVQCRKCPRLVGWREQVASEKRAAFRDWEYWGRPLQPELLGGSGARGLGSVDTKTS